MAQVTKRASISSFDGSPIPELNFEFVVDELRKGDAIPADETLDDEDMRSFVNAKRNAKARAIESAKVLKANGYEKKDLKDNPKAQLAMMVKALVAAGNTPEQALAMAAPLFPNAQ